MTKLAADPCLVLPYARAAAQVRVLLARVALVNRRAARGPSLQLIPDHAGQWAPIGGETPSGAPAFPAAAALFRRRAGIALDDPGAAARFALSPPAIRRLAGPDDRQFTAVFLEASAEGLAALAAAVEHAIQERMTDGVLAEAAVMAHADALAKLGPVSKPVGGWSKAIVELVYGGRVPQAMDTTFPALVNQLVLRSQETAEPFRIALGAVPAAG